jgi:type I restriction enzyme M protein
LDIKFNLKPVSGKAQQNKQSNRIDENSSADPDCDPVDKNNELQDLYNRLWTAADELRANSSLRSNQYSTPILGILFLRYADHRFTVATEQLEEQLKKRNRQPRKLDYQAAGVIYLPEKTRYQYLLNLPEGANIGGEMDSVMRKIESENEELRDVLPRIYSTIEDSVLVNLLKLFHQLPTELDQDLFGKIYEYFLGKFAMTEGQRGGEFYTPTSIVRLIVEILEPYHGRILDPACGSGGMFVQSAEFVRDHLKNPNAEISLYGQEMVVDTIKLCKMNLGIHGLSGDIRQGSTYDQDAFDMFGQFDYVMANPPFNVSGVDKEVIKDDPRYPFGIPRPDNANYLWIQVFYSMLNKNGRAGFVIANPANDAGYSELEIRKKMITEGVIDCIIAIGSNFFYSVSLPVTLWFFDKQKKTTMQNGTVLFIDAREIYTQVDRTHRELSEHHIEFISNIVKLYRGKKIDPKNCISSLIKANFPDIKYQDVKGLCKKATIEEIKDNGWSLNPGLYVGIKDHTIDNSDFEMTINNAYNELKILSENTRNSEKRILGILEKIRDLNE